MNKEAGSFAWNIQKENENVRKHGISFTEAAEVFRDQTRPDQTRPERSLLTNAIANKKSDIFALES